MKHFLAYLASIAFAVAMVSLVYAVAPFIRVAAHTGPRDCDRAGYCPPHDIRPTDTMMKFSTATDAGSAREVFRLEPGGCLRGPLKFFGDHAEVKYALAAGEYYPTGCGEQAQ